jgi:type I restriction enzyme S subunit
MYLMAKNFKAGGIDLSSVEYIAREQFEAHFKDSPRVPTVPHAGDVLVSIIGTLGEPYVVKAGDEFGLSSSVAILRPDLNKVLSQYLYYWLKAPRFQDAVFGIKGGVAQSYLSLGMIKSLPVVLPSLSAQRKIADILSAYDDLIENNNRRIRLLEEMAERIYREWFADFRYPGHENIPLVDSKLGPIPKGWKVVPLAAVCGRITDGAHQSPATTPVGKPMASVKDMTPRRLSLDTCRRIGLEDYVGLVRQDCQPRLGDVLIAKDGSYLKHVFVVRREEEVVILSSIALLRPNSAIQPDILSLYLHQPEAKDRLKGFVSGVALPRIVLKDFRIFSVVLPSDALQRDFVTRVDPLLQMAFALDDANISLRATRDLLLRPLLSGEIDVSALNIEVSKEVA